MRLNCDHARPLIPRYLDAELIEPDAGELRRHLLACQPCRTATQGEKALRRWFQAEAEVAVPPGFSARVARFAFAGAEPSGSFLAATESTPAAGPPARVEREGRVLPFVLRLTSVAAALLIALAGWMGSLERPTAEDLRADDARQLSVEEIERALEALNAPEPAAPGADGAAGTQREPRSER